MSCSLEKLWPPVRGEVWGRRLRPAPAMRGFERSRVRRALGRSAGSASRLPPRGAAPEGPHPFGGRAARTGRGQLLQPAGHSLPARALSPKDCLKCCPFTSAHGALGAARAAAWGGRGLGWAGLSRVIPTGCAHGHCSRGSTHNTWPRCLASPSVCPLLSSWSCRERHVEPLPVHLLQRIFGVSSGRC